MFVSPHWNHLLPATHGIPAWPQSVSYNQFTPPSLHPRHPSLAPSSQLQPIHSSQPAHNRRNCARSTLKSIHRPLWTCKWPQPSAAHSQPRMANQPTATAAPATTNSTPASQAKPDLGGGWLPTADDTSSCGSVGQPSGSLLCAAFGYS